MAVEIHVLTGSQQGRCLRFDGPRIHVGDDPAADLRFDPDRDAAACGRNAVLTLDEEEGWRIANEGAGVWLVNQTPLDRSQSQRLRSEDLLRVSELGPDLRFRLVPASRGMAVPAAAAPANCEAKGEGQPQADVPWRQENAADATAPVSPFAHEAAAIAPEAPHETAKSAQVSPNVTVVQPEPNPQTDAAQPAEPSQSPAPRRKRRESRPLSRLIGVVISGLLGLACAYALACCVGGKKNDVFHVFYSSHDSPPKARGEP